MAGPEPYDKEAASLHSGEGATVVEKVTKPTPVSVELETPPPEPQYGDLGKSRQWAIMASMVLTQLIQMIPFGAGITGAVHIARNLGVDDPAKAVWIAASYPLTQGAFILPGGRLGAVFGHKKVLFIGAFIWVAFTLGSGFSKNLITLCILRAFSGIGGGIMVPNTVAILGITFPPGRMRNLAMGFFGAAGPVGAAGGGVVSGVFAQFTPWKWVFFFLTIAGTLIFTAAFIVTPPDEIVDPNGSIDFVGAYLGVAGLFLFNFVWNQAPAVKWTEPYEYILLIVAVAHFVAFAFWEMRVAREPILPFTIWHRPSFRPLTVIVFLTFMNLGIILWYVATWGQAVRHYTPIAVAGSLSPLVFISGPMALVSAWLIPRMSVQYIVAIGEISIIIGGILIGTMPAHQVYWAQAFPGVAILSVAPDFVVTMAQIVAANSVRRSEQGVAGSLIGVLQTYGQSTGLGFAGTVETYVNDGGQNLVKGYRGALFLGVGMSVAALILDLVFVRMPKDESEGWHPDDLAIMKERQAEKERQAQASGA